MNKRFASTSLVFLSVSALGLLITVSSARGTTFDFNYSLPPLGPSGISVSANGTFATSAFDGTAFLITGITGFRNGEAITGLLPPKSFSGNDNFLFPTSPLVDLNGVSFTVAGLGNDGSGNVNLFFDGAGYTENSANVGDGTLTVTAVTNPLPEPGSMALVVVGLLALVYLRCKSPTHSF